MKEDVQKKRKKIEMRMRKSSAPFWNLTRGGQGIIQL